MFHPWYQIYAQISVCSSTYQRNVLSLSLKETTKVSRYSRPLSIREYCPWLSFWRDEKAELKCGLHQLFQIHWPRTLWSYKHRISDHRIALFEKGRPRLWKMSLQLTGYSHICVYKEFLHSAGHSSLGQWTQPCNTWHFFSGPNVAFLVDNSQSEWWFSYFCKII